MSARRGVASQSHAMLDWKHMTGRCLPVILALLALLVGGASGHAQGRRFGGARTGMGAGAARRRAAAAEYRAAAAASWNGGRSAAAQRPAAPVGQRALAAPASRRPSPPPTGDDGETGGPASGAAKPAAAASRAAPAGPSAAASAAPSVAPSAGPSVAPSAAPSVAASARPPSVSPSPVPPAPAAAASPAPEVPAAGPAGWLESFDPFYLLGLVPVLLGWAFWRSPATVAVAPAAAPQVVPAPVARGSAVTLTLPPPRSAVTEAALPALTGLPERFAEVRFLAQGGMGVVYAARDRDLDRPVAIKTLSPALAADADFVERFFRESRAMARLSHPGIVAVYDVGRAPAPYIVMEFLEGQTLKRKLTDGALSYRQRLQVALAVTRALAFAHAGGVLHRDVKPDNVMLTTDGRTKLLDFGLARMTDLDAGDARLTRPHAVMGTPYYMAPELMMGTPASAATDAFALGRMLEEVCRAAGPDGTLRTPGPALAGAIEAMVRMEPAARGTDLEALAQELEVELALLDPSITGRVRSVTESAVP